MSKKTYQESPEAANGYRKAYVDGLNTFIQKLAEESTKKRDTFFPPEALPEKLEEYRQKYLDAFGISRIPVGNPETTKKEFVAEDDICKIYRVTISVAGVIPFYGILMIPHCVKKPAPLVIAQHGGGGTPELCADFHGKNNYSHMVQRLLARGAVVFAPQLLLWRTEGAIDTCPAYEVPYQRPELDNELRRFGITLPGLQIASISRAIDWLITLPEADNTKIGMIGLSYGGFYTLYTMAADTRISAGYACSAFNDRDKYPWLDMVSPDSGNTFRDAEVAALCAPRKLYVSIGKEDDVFDYRYALPEGKRAQAYFTAMGASDNFVFDVWEGGHTVKSTDEGYDFLFEGLK